MFGLENRGKTLIFMSRHFDKTITILISHFLCTKNFNWWLFCDDNKSDNIFQTKKLDVLFILVLFPELFLPQFFPFTLYRVAYKWRMYIITYQQVNE